MLDRRDPHAPPSKFNADQRMLFGFTYRQLLIVVAFSIVGLMTFLSLYGKLKSPIVPGICTAVIALAGQPGHSGKSMATLLNNGCGIS